MLWANGIVPQNEYFAAFKQCEWYDLATSCEEHLIDTWPSKGCRQAMGKAYSMCYLEICQKFYF